MNWLGCSVSVSCGHTCYQGTIVDADGAAITLDKTFKDGLPNATPTITIRASDITFIKMLRNEDRTPSPARRRSTVEVIKSAKKSHRVLTNGTDAPESTPGRSASADFQNSKGANNGFRSKPIDIQTRQRNNNGNSYDRSAGSGPCLSTSAPNKREKERRRNEICFGTPSDDPLLAEEFDFEKNLALFDKRALWEELNQQRPDVVRQTDVRGGRSQPKYRHDENILESRPVTLAQSGIVVPLSCRGPKQYVTDEGIIVPTLTRELRTKLFAACARAGLEGAELFARAATEFALRLLGGAHRLQPRNDHQTPNVAFLVGPHWRGVVGVACARQLASHGVSTTVLTAPGRDVRGALVSHLIAYKLTGERVVTDVRELPAVDLIVAASCDDSDRPSVDMSVADWVSRSRAPVLALDPPPDGMPDLVARYSLLPILPLAHSPDNGKLYLCNLAVPTKIFEDQGIRYTSPFGAKFVIALHPKD